MAAVAVTDIMCVIGDLDKVSALLEILHYQIPCILSHHSTVLLGNILIERSIRIEEVDCLKVVALSAFEVIRIVGWRDFYHACTELHIDEPIGNDRDLPVRKRKQKLLAYNALVALIIRINGNCGIAEHRFRTRCLVATVIYPDPSAYG